MFKKKALQLAFAAWLGASTIGAAAHASSEVNGFDFSYSVDLDKTIGIVQVFDDGDRTYFQLNQFDKLPTVYVERGKGRELAKLEVKPPYLIANGVAKRYTLSSGKRSISVTYNGDRVAQRNQPTAEQSVTAAAAEQKTQAVEKAQSVEKSFDDQQSDMAVVKPAQSSSKSAVKVSKSIAKKKADPVKRQAPEESNAMDDDLAMESAATSTPSKEKDSLITGVVLNVPFFENSVTLSKRSRDELGAQATEIKKSSQVVVRGRPSAPGDSTMAKTRALAVKGYLIDLGVQESNIQISVSDKVKAGKNDGFYLSEVIMFNGGQAPHKAKVPVQSKDMLQIHAGDKISESLQAWARGNNWILAWDAPEVIAEADVTVRGDFDRTIESVINAMNRSGSNLHATLYEENRVLRIMEKK